MYVKGFHSIVVKNTRAYIYGTKWMPKFHVSSVQMQVSKINAN